MLLHILSYVFKGSARNASFHIPRPLQICSTLPLLHSSNPQQSLPRIHHLSHMTESPAHSSFSLQGSLSLPVGGVGAKMHRSSWKCSSPCKVAKPPAFPKGHINMVSHAGIKHLSDGMCLFTRYDLQVQMTTGYSTLFSLF